MYKDREEQRLANREHARAYRMRRKGMTQGMTQIDTGMTVNTKEEAEKVVKKLVTSEDAAKRFTICLQHKVFRYTCGCV